MPLLVSNHLGYLDILVLAAVAPVQFVAKAEVRRWPWFGWLARCGGTLFLRRDQSRSLVKVTGQLRERVANGNTIVVFPEATSTAGEAVLAFRSGLLSDAAAEGWLVQPAGLRYEASADVRQTVCWWGEMRFLPHLWRLLGQEWIRARVKFGRALYHWDRKELARQLHAAVVGLAAASHHGAVVPAISKACWRRCPSPSFPPPLSQAFAALPGSTATFPSATQNRRRLP